MAVTIGGTVTKMKWQGGAAPTFIVEASAPFIDASGIPVNNGGGPFREEWATSVNGSGYVVLPDIALTPTENSSDPSVTYFAYFQKANTYDPQSRTPFSTFGPNRGFRVPDASPTTWEALDANMGTSLPLTLSDRTVRDLHATRNVIVDGTATFYGPVVGAVKSFQGRDGAVTLRDEDLNGRDGSGLVGVGTGTGGTSNTGSTSIDADTDEDGVGVVALRTRNQNRLVITNDGDTQIFGDLLRADGMSAFDRGLIVLDPSRPSAQIVEAHADAEAEGKGVLYTGKCVVEEMVTLSKPPLLIAASHGAGLYAAAGAIPAGQAVLRLRPSAFPNNEGFRLIGVTLSHEDAVENPANAGEWLYDGTDQVHALWIDGTGAPSTANIESLHIEGCHFLPAGGHAIYAPASNPNGVPAKSTLIGGLYYGGILAGGLGDSWTIVGGKSVGPNYALDLTQTLGATQLIILGHNATNPAGCIFRGPFERPQIIGGIYEGGKDYGGTLPFCPEGAYINFVGTDGGHCVGPIIRGAHVSILSGFSADCIRLDYVDSAHISDTTLTTTDEANFGIVISNHCSSVVIGDNYTRIAGSNEDGTPKYISNEGAGTRYDGYTFAVRPSSNARAAGLRGHASYVGWGQFGEGLLTGVEHDAAGLGQVVFNEGGITAGGLRMPSEIFADALRIRDVELFALTTGSGVSVWAMQGGVLTRVAKFQPGGDMELFTDGAGFIAKSPDGTRYRKTVDNSGNWVTTTL